MSNYANEQLGSHQQMTGVSGGGSSNDYYNQQLRPQDQIQQPQYDRPAQNSGTTNQYDQHFQTQQTNMQQQAGQANGGRMNGNSGGQQLGAGEPAQSAQQDSLHKFLDKIEKKFGGTRFNNPDNYEKNKKLNDSIILKITQVAKTVMQRAPRMVMGMMR